MNFLYILAVFIISFFLIEVTLFTNFSSLDASSPWQFGFQDPATPVMDGIITFHHDLMFFLIVICVFVMWLIFRIIVLFNSKANPVPIKFVHGTFIEVVWTIIPALVLIIIAIPSFSLLYSMDECCDPSITLKAVGHQWYWHYEYSDYETSNGDSLTFESYMIPEDDLEFGDFRLIEVDNRVVLPTNTHIRLIVTSADVIHCWAMPSFGVKLDACPGRLNQTSLFIKREGVFYGQCSEICGVNHGFMPIAVEAVSLSDYVSFIIAKLEDF